MAKPPPLPPLPGQPTPRVQTVGSARFKALRRIGRWPVGVAHEGLDLETQERCTIVFPDVVGGDVDAFISIMEDEVARNRLLVGLPVVGVRHVSRTINKAPYLVLPDTNGPNLDTQVSHHGPLPPVAALQVAVMLADGLTRMHYRARFIGELRPWTVLLPADRSETLRVVDLGIPRGLFDRSISPPKVTPFYASPAVRGGRTPDLEDDLYALGALVFFMLTGQPPPGLAAPYASRLRPLGPFGSFVDGLLVQAITPKAAPSRLTTMKDLARMLRGLRDLHRLSPSAQRAVLMLRMGSRGMKPPPVPGMEPLPEDAVGFIEADGPSFLTQAELESIESHSSVELESVDVEPLDEE